ncbi:MAG: hypothetical protein AABX59_01430 [Nanoarchaeota archaeon]
MAESSLREDILRSTIVAALIGGLLGFLVGLTNIPVFGLSGLPALLIEIVVGMVFGALVGLVLGITPPRYVAVVISVLVLAAIVALSILIWRWYSQGLLQTIIGPYAPSVLLITSKISQAVNCVVNPVECFYKPFYDWSVPTIEEEEEEVSVNIEFTGKNVFESGEEIETRNTVIVKNPSVPELLVQPVCLLDNQQISTELPRADFGNILRFRKSELEQRSQVICRAPGIKLEEGLESKSSILKIKIEREVTARSSWNVYTLRKDILEQSENPFLNINEPNLKAEGRIVLSSMEFDAPAFLSIGSDEDQPFYDSVWPFSVRIKKRNDVIGNLTVIQDVVLEIPQGNLVILEPCDFSGSFSISGGTFQVKKNILERANKILGKSDEIEFKCNFRTTSEDQDIAQKTVIRAIAKYKFESEFQRGIIILAE